MQISAKTDYAVRALLALAAEAPDLVKIDMVVGEQQLPRKFVEAILGDLRRAGIVRSMRGADGGYALARPAEEISIGVGDPGGRRAAGRGPRAAPGRDELHRRGRAPARTLGGGAGQPAPVLDETSLQQLLTGELPPHVRKMVDDPEAWARRAR